MTAAGPSAGARTSTSGTGTCRPSTTSTGRSRSTGRRPCSSADGSFRIVIAHRDPGVPNWLDTEGRPFGLVFWRYFLPTGPIETPQAEVVPVDSLR